MKYYLTLLTLCIVCVCTAQIGNSKKNHFFKLTGKLLGRDTGYIVLEYPDTSGIWLRDTSYLENGNFIFDGMVKEPSFAHLIGSDKQENYSNFFLEQGNQTVVLKENHFDKAQMKGSKTQELYDSLQKEINKISLRIGDLEKERDKLDSVVNNRKDKAHYSVEEQKLHGVNTKISELYNEMLNKRINFINNHPDSYVSVTELTGLLIVNHYGVNLIKPLYEALSTELKNSRAGLYCLKEIEVRSKLAAGSYLSNFQANDFNNKYISLSDFRNKYVLLDFWASWCAPCRQEIPHLKKVYEKYHSNGFEIIAVSLDQDKDKWKKAIQVDDTRNWVQVLKSGELETIFKPIQIIPQHILLDKTGKIIWSSLDQNASTWTETLENKFKPTLAQ